MAWHKKRYVTSCYVFYLRKINFAKIKMWMKEDKFVYNIIKK